MPLTTFDVGNDGKDKANTVIPDVGSRLASSCPVALFGDGGNFPHAYCCLDALNAGVFFGGLFGAMMKNQPPPPPGVVAPPQVFQAFLFLSIDDFIDKS